VDDLRVRGEQFGLAGDTVVEPGAECDQEIGLLQRQHGRDRAVHAGHADVLRVRVGEGAARHQRGHHGRARELGQRQQLGRRTAADDAAADVQHGLLGLGDQRGRGLDLLAVRLGHGTVARQVVLGRPHERGRGLLGVLGDVHENGTGTTRAGDLERRGDRAGDVLGRLHQDRVLGDRHRDADDVGLLERVRAHQAGEHLTGDRDDRDGVHVGVRDRGDEVRRTGAGGGDGHADLAGGGGVPLGGVPAALLVAHEDVAQLGRCHQGVVDLHDRAAGNAEDVGDAEELEGAHDGLRAGEDGRRRRTGGRTRDGWSGISGHEGSLRW
jgi:hypothetical protein